MKNVEFSLKYLIHFLEKSDRQHSYSSESLSDISERQRSSVTISSFDLKIKKIILHRFKRVF